MQSNSKITDDEFLGLTGKLKTVPPGFERGLTFDKDDVKDEIDLGAEDDELDNLVKMVRGVT